MKTTKEYTPWRQFLAWVGFITLLVAFPAVITFVVWAQNYVGTALAEQTAHIRMQEEAKVNEID